MTYSRRALIGAIFLLLMLTLAYRQVLAPEVRQGTGLDYEALSLHVAQIAQKPHPLGSAANREARDYIVGYFESLGLETEVQKTTVVYRHPTKPPGVTTVGFVENIIARLPARSRPAETAASDLVLMSHYDSRPLTPGAGDAASGTASIMEVARIMASGPAPAHDVVFLITDGEEMGLLGAQGFFRQHPAAKNVGLVLNLEARGSYGASFMFETSNNNSWLVRQLLKSTPDLVASSLSYEIYRLMPNDTDMSISKGEGVPGLNFAFSAGLFDYHAMTDNAANLSTNSLAHHANNMLAAAQHFAHIEDWQSAEADLTYFNLFQGTLISYSQGMAVGLGVLVLLFGVWLFVTALRVRSVTTGTLVNGMLGVLVLFLVVYSLFENLIVYMQKADAGITRLTSLGEWPFLAFFVLTLGFSLWLGHRLKRGLGRVDILVPVLVLTLLVLAGGNTSLASLAPPLIAGLLMIIIRSRSSGVALWTATVTVWWLLTAVLVYIAPNASYLFVWPLVSVLLGLAVHRLSEGVGSESMHYPSVLVFSFVPLLILAPVYIVAYLALGLGLPQVLMMICALSLWLIWPLLRDIAYLADGKFALLLLGAGFVMTLVVILDRDFDARHPRGEELFYAIDADHQQGFWVSSDARAGSWLGGFMGEGADTGNMTRIIPGYDQGILIKNTPLPVYEAATLTVNSDRLVNGMREIDLHLRSGAAAEYVNLLFAVDAGITAAAINGFPVSLPETQDLLVSDMDGMSWWRWRLYGLPSEGADIVLTTETDQPVPVRIVEVDYQMPPGAPVRPDDSTPRKYTWSDSTVIFQTQVVE